MTARDARYDTLVPAPVDASPKHGTLREALIVVARRWPVSGTVVDPSGRPVADAELALGVDQELFRRLGVERGFAAQPESWTTRSDREGSFELTDALADGAHYLSARKPGYEPVRVELTGYAPGEPLVVVLRPDGSGAVWGTVLDPDGAPAAGAQVSVGDEIEACDGEGRFLLPLAGERREASGSLLAVKPGYLPARLDFAAGGLASPVVLQLGEAPASIRGRVVDGEGRPAPGVVVWVRDPTPFGAQRIDQAAQAIRLRVSVEEALRGGFGERGAVTGADGAFELGGLLPREYRLAAVERETLCEVDGVRARAGGGKSIEIVLERGTVARVAGRVVSLAGEPVEGVRLFPSRARGDEGFEGPPLLGDGSAPVTTDAEGRFELSALCVEDTSLALMEDGPLARTRVGLSGFPNLGEVEIRFPRTCELRVELLDPSQADRLSVLDADGEPLRLLESFGIFLGNDFDAELDDGRSGILKVDERAHTLVLFLGDEEVARCPLELVPGEVSVVQL